MASLRRNKTLSPDGQTARFLYTIIKQLDLKSIDWNLVAGSLEITNGHAARMRYSRFKQHMEGVTTQPRAPRTGGKKEKEKEGKEGLEKPKKGKKRGLEEAEQEKEKAKDDWQGCVKRGNLAPEPAGTRLKAEDHSGLQIKPEPDAAPSPTEVQIKPEPGLTTSHFLPEVESPAPVAIKPEALPNREDAPSNPDIWRILPHSSTKAATEHSFLPRISQCVIDPALTMQQPLLGPFSQFNAPPVSQQTVSLAQLEVSPRLPRMNDASVSAATAPMQIKTEPEPEPEVEWLAVPPKGVAGLRIKNEPVEV